MLAEGAAVAKEAASHRTVNDCYVGRLIRWRIRVGVLCSKVTPGEQRNTHGFKVTRRDSDKTLIRDFALTECAAIDHDVDSNLLTIHWREARKGNGSHARKLRYITNRLIIELCD